MANSIITVATLKGGSGKTTVASCLAVHWQLAGRNPVLVDADPQRSIARLAARERALGGVKVVEDASENVLATARRLAVVHDPVVIDSPGFRSATTFACFAAADLVLIPVKPSPLDTDRMLDTLDIIINGLAGRGPIFRCLLTQITRDSVIARHIRAEIREAGFQLLASEMASRVAYPEAGLYGATPSLIDRAGPAARDITTIAKEIDAILEFKLAASA
jgi:chromosome partitioning protein